MGKKIFISIALYLKVFIKKIKICSFKKAVDIINNRNNLNNELKN